MRQTPMAAGLADPVHDAQAAFRQALDALSRPGRRVTLGATIPGMPLGAAMAHLLLTLTDDDTSVWWQNQDAQAAQWLRFHTGATRVVAPDAAAFAVVLHPERMPPLAAFAAGSAASPDVSATLLVEVPSFDGGPALALCGPGIRTVESVQLQGLASDFWPQWQSKHAAFPQGIDILFTCGHEAMGLPRTTRLAHGPSSLVHSSSCT
jgi:alpha-D-ribose 1-methylphosphonate 5-triphosphate synthase subunit PhnH